MRQDQPKKKSGLIIFSSLFVQSWVFFFFFLINIKKSSQLSGIFNKAPQSDNRDSLTHQTTIFFNKNAFFLFIILPKILLFS
jgi:hypothetical protein